MFRALIPKPLNPAAYLLDFGRIQERQHQGADHGVGAGPPLERRPQGGVACVRRGGEARDVAAHYLRRICARIQLLSMWKEHVN